MLSHRGCLSTGQPSSFLSPALKKQLRLPAGGAEGEGAALFTLCVGQQSQKDSEARQEESSLHFS